MILINALEHSLISLFHFHYPQSDTYLACTITKTSNLFLCAPIHPPICHFNSLLKTQIHLFAFSAFRDPTTHKMVLKIFHSMAQTSPSGFLPWNLPREHAIHFHLLCFSSDLGLKCAASTWTLFSPVMTFPQWSLSIPLPDKISVLSVTLDLP